MLHLNVDLQRSVWMLPAITAHTNVACVTQVTRKLVHYGQQIALVYKLILMGLILR